MKTVSWIGIAAMFALASGCASNPQKESAPQIQRISAEELEQLLPKPDPNLTYEELVRLSHEGVTAEALIEKIKQSNSSYELTPSQALELGRKGVDPKVLDFMHAQREQTLREGFADELNKRDREHQSVVEQLRREAMMRPMCDPFWGPYPPYWRYPYPYPYRWR